MSEGRAAVWRVETCIVAVEAEGGKDDDGPGSAVVGGGSSRSLGLGFLLGSPDLSTSQAFADDDEGIPNLSAGAPSSNHTRTRDCLWMNRHFGMGYVVNLA